MKINIIKALSNKKFINKKNDNYYALSYFTKRIWLAEDSSVISDGSVVYSISFISGLSAEGRILGTGFDNIGFYIIFRMDPLLDNDIELLDKIRIPTGEAVLSEVFNPHEDEVFKALSVQGFMGQYSFLGSIFNHNNTENSIVFEFYLGALGDVAFKIKLTDIIEEKSICDNNDGFNSFKSGKIKEVYFRKNCNGEYVIKIDNSYKDYIYPEGYDFFSGPLNPEIVQHKNVYLIKCKGIYVQKYNYFIELLKSKNINFELYSDKENYAEAIRKKWKDVFLESVDTDNIYIDQYLWHVFSFERLNAISGDAAAD